MSISWNWLVLRNALLDHRRLETVKLSLHFRGCFGSSNDSTVGDVRVVFFGLASGWTIADFL